MAPSIVVREGVGIRIECVAFQRVRYYETHIETRGGVFTTLEEVRPKID